MQNPVSDHATAVSQHSRLTARIENGGIVYEQPATGVETTDTEFVEARTRRAAASGGR